METNNEVKTPNSLMRKTKAELVNIILRKDDVEKNLRDDIKGLNTSFEEMTKKYVNAQNNLEDIQVNYEKLSKAKEAYENDFEEISDKLVTERVESRISISRLKRNNNILLAIIIIYVLIEIMFLFLK